MTDEIVAQVLVSILPFILGFMVFCFFVFSVCLGFGFAFLGDLHYIYRFFRKMKRVRRIRKLKGCK